MFCLDRVARGVGMREGGGVHSRQLMKMLRRDTVIGGVAMTSKNVLPHPLLLLH